jgi:hypothetical protein
MTFERCGSAKDRLTEGLRRSGSGERTVQYVDKRDRTEGVPFLDELPCCHSETGDHSVGVCVGWNDLVSLG